MLRKMEMVTRTRKRHFLAVWSFFCIWLRWKKLEWTEWRKARGREKTQRQHNCVYKDEFSRSILFHVHQYNTISNCFSLNCYCVIHLIFQSFFFHFATTSLHIEIIRFLFFIVVWFNFEQTTKQNEKKIPFLFISPLSCQYYLFPFLIYTFLYSEINPTGSSQ